MSEQTGYQPEQENTQGDFVETTDLGKPPEVDGNDQEAANNSPVSAKASLLERIRNAGGKNIDLSAPKTVVEQKAEVEQEQRETGADVSESMGEVTASRPQVEAVVDNLNQLGAEQRQLAENRAAAQEKVLQAKRAVAELQRNLDNLQSQIDYLPTARRNKVNTLTKTRDKKLDDLKRTEELSDLQIDKQTMLDLVDLYSASKADIVAGQATQSATEKPGTAWKDIAVARYAKDIARDFPDRIDDEDFVAEEATKRYEAEAGGNIQSLQDFEDKRQATMSKMYGVKAHDNLDFFNQRMTVLGEASSQVAQVDASLEKSKDRLTQATEAEKPKLEQAKTALQTAMAELAQTETEITNNQTAIEQATKELSQVYDAHAQAEEKLSERRTLLQAKGEKVAKLVEEGRASVDQLRQADSELDAEVTQLDTLLQQAEDEQKLEETTKLQALREARDVTLENLVSESDVRTAELDAELEEIDLLTDIPIEGDHREKLSAKTRFFKMMTQYGPRIAEINNLIDVEIPTKTQQEVDGITQKSLVEARQIASDSRAEVLELRNQHQQAKEHLVELRTAVQDTLRTLEASVGSNQEQVQPQNEHKGGLIRKAANRLGLFRRAV